MKYFYLCEFIVQLLFSYQLKVKMSAFVSSNMSINSMNIDECMEAGLLTETFDWVDQLLREKYYAYALNSESVDEFMECGLLTENFDWVDRRLEEMDRETYFMPPRPCLLCWIGSRSNAKNINFPQEELEPVVSEIQFCEDIPPFNNIDFEIQEIMGFDYYA